ncbi:MAG: methionyl-tRNA formyltransferase [Acidobacteria bacterium]|nr:MAG: methionyl-tRNA formyltransferase [Acidobacteriota bacterium]RLE33249.1 MAG: methionyl-tRNA formyltransferase [Acidobacteriota bacterium]
MKVVFFGTPDFAVPSLDHLVESDHKVVFVITRPDKPIGRKKVLTPPPVAEAARRHDLEVWQPKSLKGPSVADRIRESGADVAAVVAYGRIIPLGCLNAVPQGMVNVHPSLLPRHRGPSPIQWALVSGDRRTGVSTMLLDEGQDTGPILLQETVEIDPRETAEQLSPRLAVIGAHLLVRTLDELAAGTLESHPQPVDGITETPMLRREFARIDWSRPARQQVNRLRGFTPWPGLYTIFREDRLKIFGLEEAEIPPGSERPGYVLSADGTGIIVRCGKQTAVRITEVQREGRRRMPVDAFLIGERVGCGEHLG